jgi:hypothetical protein
LAGMAVFLGGDGGFSPRDIATRRVLVSGGFPRPPKFFTGCRLPSAPACELGFLILKCEVI